MKASDRLWLGVLALFGVMAGAYIVLVSLLADHPVEASGILSIPSTVVQTNQSNTYTTGTQNFAAAVHTAPTIVVATVPDLPATCTVNGELAIVKAATPGQQIYENSADPGPCTWTQQLNTGSSSGGGVITYSGAGVTLTGTLFFPAGGGGVPSGTESNVDLASSSAGTITNLSAQMSVAPGMGNSVVITWRKGGADQSSTCTISGAVSTECQDTTHSFNVSQGDLIAYKVVATGIIAGTPNLAMMSQFGTTQSGGTVNSGTIGQCGYYAATGTAISGFTPSGDLGSTCPTPTVVNGSHITNSSIPNNGLVNASTTVNTVPCALGASCTVTAAASGTAGGDLSGTYPNPSVFNGSHITNASIPNSGLVNASITINGATCTLGSTCTPSARIIASGTSALGTGAISSAACATVVTTSATGTLSTDTIVWNPNVSIKALTGYTPATTGGLSIAAYPTADNVNFDVCNWSSGSLTPSALTLNWKVVR